MTARSDESLTMPYLSEPGTPRNGVSQQSVNKVELVDNRASHADSERIRLYSWRIRCISLMFLITYFAFAVRDLLSMSGNWRDPQLLVLLFAVLLQFGIVVLCHTAGPRYRLGRFVIESLLILLAGVVIDTLHYMHMIAWDTYSEYLTHFPRDAQILMANTWSINWLALIVGYSVAIPRVWRQTMLVAFLMSMNPIAVTLIAMQTVPELQTVETRYFFGQFVIWSMVSVVIAGFAAAQTNKLREQVRQARRFGQYLLKEKIGEGGMGEVFLAEHGLLKRPCVIKQVRPDRAQDQRVLARFEREVKLLATLTNWHTVEVFDYGRASDGSFYYVMEYLPGLNLEDLVRLHGVLPPERAAYLLAQVCAGLHEAHTVGLIHRDIKPNNIIVGPRGGMSDVAKLLDFGLVQGPTDSDDYEDPFKITREGTIVGTVSYMSPEQVRGEPLDGRSDLYSLGVTLFFLLEGRTPFLKRTPMDTLAAHLHEPVPPTSQAVSQDVRHVIERCLAKNVLDRYQNAKELREALLVLAAPWNETLAQEWWLNRQVVIPPSNLSKGH